MTVGGVSFLLESFSLQEDPMKIKTTYIINPKKRKELNFTSVVLALTRVFDIIMILNPCKCKQNSFMILSNSQIHVGLQTEKYAYV